MSTELTDSASQPSHAVTPAPSGLSVLAWQSDPAVQEIHIMIKLKRRL